jgi:transposase
MLSMLRYKAERGGGWFAVIDARNASQQCSAARSRRFCRSVSKRCTDCKMEVHRDVNAARNVLKRAGAGQWGGGFARTTASLQAVVAETLGAKLAA